MAERPLSSLPSHDTLKVASYTPLPLEEDSSLAHPRAPFMGTESLASPPSQDYSLRNSQLLATGNKEPYGETATPPPPTKGKRRPLFLALVALAVLAVIIIAIIVPVYFTVIKPKNRNTSAAAASSGGSTPGSSPTGTSPKPGTKNAIMGGDGSTVLATNGSTFTYNNQFGGIWYADPNDPYNNNAYPNSWTPPLNTSWNFGTNRIYGVNLGGWFVLEPFISPALFQKYPGAVDEWTLSTLMAADTANGGLNQLEDHYKTFITEDDIAAIAAAGLNWVRLPVPFWAIDIWDDEPFLARTSWKYILQALGWCRKYGIRVKLDLHTIPGSQNGYNHSGKLGQINFLRGTMGIANAERALNYIRIFTEFISQPEWKDVVGIFGIVNEPTIEGIGEDVIKAFNYEAYRMIRDITGVGEGKGPYISFHDGFGTVAKWAGFLTGADRIAIDGHPYFAFDSPQATDSVDSGTGTGAGGVWPARACDRWGAQFNNSRVGFGVTIAGEWSNAVNDCGLFVRGTVSTSVFGNCDAWNDYSSWSAGTKAGLLELSKASMDAFGDWFFWTWKIGASQKGVVEAPFWSYQLGMQGGWIPTDPRTAIGKCGGTGPAFSGTFLPWQTGGAGAGQVAMTYDWPPATIMDAPVAAAQLPTYTPTGTISTLPVPTYTDTSKKTVVKGNGWANSNDNTPAPTKIAGCAYPDPWAAQNSAVPAGCGVPAAAGGPTAVVTPGTATATTTTPPLIPVLPTATTATDIVR
ncbi:glycoside hydrolase superfamily [Crepidotus variabilis]|uniref:glucan 1,3-beta-glucosidase n=1 Tax=Crepidotus variabilis TaxID=179855 RepID=A0A9P6E9K6_9AGAR|nr:glycoside hydrolase superfamily [Crepidotus variabilis]